MKRQHKKVLVGMILLVAVKLVFVGSNADEGYGIELAWRLARGDRMLLELWEPHQTSAVFGAALVRIFWLFSGGSSTGLILYMHICGIGFQFLTAYFLYRVLKTVMPQEMEDFAFCAGCIYALCYPKGVIAPEYSNLQNWFTTGCALCFVMFMHRISEKSRGRAENGGCWRYLLFSGICLSGAVLAYPSMVILYPVMIVLLCCGLREKRLRAVLVLSVPCLLFAGIFTGYLFSYMNMEQISRGIAYVLNDGAHSAGVFSKLDEICMYGLTLALRCLICFGTAYAGTVLLRKKMLLDNKVQIRLAACFAALLAAFVWQIAYWLFRDEFVNQPQTELVLLCILAVILYIHSEKEAVERELFYLVVFSGTGLLAAVILSNFRLIELVVYLGLGAVAGAGILYKKGEDIFRAPEQKMFWRKLALTVLGIWVITLSFGRVWVTSQGRELHTTPFEIRNIQKSGPGIGILTNYMTGYRYNTIAGEWDELIQDGEALLYVGPSSFYYMFGDVVISSPNTISTPIYDETIFEYWEMHPERYPDVVFVESCYGDLIYGEENFMIRWLNEEYGASSVTDLEYIRVYRR